MNDFPDLDFGVDCPICDTGLEYDEAFYCPECCVSWPRNGYGHEAESDRTEHGLCEARCPSSANILDEGRFCSVFAGHDCDHEVRSMYAGRERVTRWQTEDGS
jgi:hypothetical protein